MIDFLQVFFLHPKNISTSSALVACIIMLNEYKRTAMQSRELSGNSYPIRGVCTLAHSQLVGMFVLIESIPHT